MILNFIMGFVAGVAFVLVYIFAIAWANVQEKKRKGIILQRLIGRMENILRILRIRKKIRSIKK